MITSHSGCNDLEETNTADSSADYRLQIADTTNQTTITIISPHHHLALLPPSSPPHSAAVVISEQEMSGRVVKMNRDDIEEMNCYLMCGNRSSFHSVPSSSSDQIFRYEFMKAIKQMCIENEPNRYTNSR
jgi:hypothetical protein